MRRPMLSKREVKIDPHLDQKQLSDILRDDDMEVEEDSKSSDSDTFMPIKLVDREYSTLQFRIQYF
jgi:hypothetical protein